MNSSKEDEQVTTVAAKAFVPLKPSCRKPLNRMIDEDSSPRVTKNRHSSSPKLNHNGSYDSESSHDSNISSDSSEEYGNNIDANASGSPKYPYDKMCPTLLEGCKQRNLANSECDVVLKTSRSKSPQSLINVTFDIKSSSTCETKENVSSKSYCEHIETSQKSRKTVCRQSASEKSSILKSKQTRTAYSSKNCLVCAVVGVIGVVSLSFTLMNTATSSSIIPAIVSRQPDRMTDFLNDIKAIRTKFPGQDRHTWLQIQAGVSDVINRPQKPWLFVLFSNETTELRCLAELLGKASSRALLSENSLSLKPEDMGNEYGNAIDRLRPMIKKQKAVVVHDLLNVDPGAIQAFHTMCDRENPLVEEAVYIMTIITHDYVPGLQSPEQFVENQLTNRFINKVPDDKLQPLITRLTDGSIILVKPEVSLTACTG